LTFLLYRKEVDLSTSLRKFAKVFEDHSVWHPLPSAHYARAARRAPRIPRALLLVPPFAQRKNQAEDRYDLPLDF
jgi:hypothetical protein